MKNSLFLFIFLSSNSLASFEAWKFKYAHRASKRGLSKSFVLKILKDVQLQPEVIEKDKNQIILDTKTEYTKFIKGWLRDSPSRIERGRKLLLEHKDLLNQIENKYGVDKEIIVALWGTESLYGDVMGDYDLIRSLATLSYDGRRRDFFETQLSAALRILKQGHVGRDQLKGSWAGATGQCQFMPSNIALYAQDFDGDGKKDIWSTKADIFASIANYLKKNGWKFGKSIGDLAYNTKKKKLTLNRYRSIETYNRLGMRTKRGERLKGNWHARRLAAIPLKNSPLILRGSNFLPLLKWNRSNLFAALNIILVEGFRR